MVDTIGIDIIITVSTKSMVAVTFHIMFDSFTVFPFCAPFRHPGDLHQCMFATKSAIIKEFKMLFSPQ
ncbi:hypothetical protein QJ48_10295 [Paenibacillus sp. A3]|nr:hypothetical protein QJ48_10295 [Paenibacillus sp. A3]